MTTGDRSPHPYLGAYWRARAETPDSASRRLAAFAEALAGLHLEGLDAWYRKRNRPTAAAADLLPLAEPARAHALIEAAWTDGEGATVAAWNGDPTAGTALSVHVGEQSRWVPNSVVLNLPDHPQPSWMSSAEAATGLLRAVIAAWEPEWATFGSAELRTRQGARPPSAVVGWATYLSDPVGSMAVAALPPSARYERWADGTLITVAGTPAEPVAGEVLALRASLGGLLNSWRSVDPRPGKPEPR